MADAQRRPRLMLGLALAVVVLMAVVVSASAWLRLSQPRVACGDWPSCRIGMARVAAIAPGEADVVLGSPRRLDAVRAVHRVAATAALLIVSALVVLALRERPRRRAVLRSSSGLLALALALSALGIVTPGSRAAGVLLGNLLGGFAMLAMAMALVLRLAHAAPLLPSLTRYAGLAFGLWLVQAGLGALSGAGLVHVAPPLHLVLAVAALPLAAIVGWRAWREGDGVTSTVGVALLWLAALQFLFGAAGAGNEAQVVWVLPHNAVAAMGSGLLFALFASAQVRSRS